MVDTTQARNAGIRDGSEKGAREGRQVGYSDGINSGEWEGRRNGANEGESAGRNAGMRDGWGVDQAAGVQRGSVDGQNTGTSNGTEAGKRRCYDAGYANGYNSAYAYAKQAGLQDVASYNSGYERGRADAAVIEVQNGAQAGYQAGFSQREAELERSFPDMNAISGVLVKSAMKMEEKMSLPIEFARNGYTTAEEKRAYEAGFREGYNRSYRRAYDDAKRDGYNERYHMAYRRAYDVQFSISYRDGFAEGKERGYREAYAAAYDSAYNSHYEEYSNREYADQRAQGLTNGQAAGNRDGFAAGCAEQSKRGYKAGYEATAAEVYPDAFNAGKQSGIAAADRYYSENAVLKVFDVSFYDENTNGSFEAGENIMLRAELKNFGFQGSEAVSMAVKSERGEIVFVPDLRADGVGGRGRTVLNLKIGRLSDIVTPGADALYVTFSEKGRQFGDLRQPYSRTNNNKVGVVSKDNAKVREKAAWLFSKKLATLKLGEKVIITGNDGNWSKVRRSEVGEGNWTEGYIKTKRLSLQ
ncbi:MAG: hypothetical protein A2285_01145 [Elusimicrobia bacterium RIFOXYA12_FULL_57_11]|nr:MAG: hypothetical protein A2285_01145 [Elusimicrobia bacterium RIFOXYA12_FULL_57_11]